MAKALPSKSAASVVMAGNAPSLAELRAMRKAQHDSARRVEELKLRLLQLSEQHWDQTVHIIKQWTKMN